MKDRPCSKSSWHHALVTCGAAFLLSSGAAEAVSLGKIEVASPLNEAFFAEVPLKLEGNELASKVFIEIASSADYKIFEVYRDPVLNNIRADVASDDRGVRVKLSSRAGIKSPFFNLVLKVRYGRVSHFKKFSVFLDSSKSVQRVIEMTPLPQLESNTPAASVDTTAQAKQAATLTESAGKALVSDQDLLAAQEMIVNKPEGWARVDTYGPIVRGDSLSIVAKRLRYDHRYSINQVMVALLEKNPSSFKQGNMNLIKAGAMLKVPSAAEVEQHSKSEATQTFAEHQKAWKQRSRYSAEAETQRKRYSNRVSMGNHAVGDATAGLTVAQSTVETVDDSAKSAAVSVTETGVLGKASPQLEKLIEAQSETNQLLLALQQKNEELQQQLLANKNNVDALHQKVDEGVLEASNARVDKLEILLTRLQAELEKQALRPSMQTNSGSDWITWLLLSLLIVMLGVIAMLMRREPAHPASAQALVDGLSEHEMAANSDVKTGSHPEDKVSSLEDMVEDEVGHIEIDEQQVDHAKGTATLDSMAAFTDELSDTDTAELEPFDADAKQELDSSVDYLSEADVYIRYGMNEEALQQLDMALRLKPDHTDAHIKKAELLHNAQDKPAYATALAAATAVLGAEALASYHAAVQAFGGDIDVVADAIDQVMIETADPLTVAIDDADLADLDFGLTHLGIENADLDIDLNEPVTEQDESAVEEPADEPDEAMDWLSDPSFADDDNIQVSDIETTDIQVSEFETSELQSSVFQEPETQTISSSTQQLGSLLGEFSTDAVTSEMAVVNEVMDQSEIAFEDASVNNDVEPLAATQELGNLLSEFTEQDESNAPLAESFEAGATQHLDSLLSEFADDDDDLSFTDHLNELSTSTDLIATTDPTDTIDTTGIVDGADSATPQQDDETTPISLDIDYGATQELDHLLSEFSDEVDGLSFIEPEEVAEHVQKDLPDTDLDHGATQELDSLLGEFIEAEDGADKNDVDHGATQVLGHLLDEFSDDKDHKKD